MKLPDYEEFVLKTAKKADGTELSYNESLDIGALGASGEAGEVTDYIKKVLYHGKELDRATLLREIGDNLWYLTLLAKTIGYTLNDVIDANVEKLSERYAERL